jgi:hypothetical protein
VARLALPEPIALDLPGAAWLAMADVAGLPTVFMKAARLGLALLKEAA